MSSLLSQFTSATDTERGPLPVMHRSLESAEVTVAGVEKNTNVGFDPQLATIMSGLLSSLTSTAATDRMVILPVVKGHLIS